MLETKKILIVDNEPAVLSALSGSLRSPGVDIAALTHRIREMGIYSKKWRELC